MIEGFNGMGRIEMVFILVNGIFFIGVGGVGVVFV